MIDAIRASWGWTGIEPLEVLGVNDFGNLIVKDVHGRYWRICPEDCYCRVIAEDRAELDRLSADQAFLQDWHMSALVEQARAKLGVLSEGRKYCLRIPGVLGGEYSGDNLASAPIEEIIAFSGDVARQIDELPDGAVVELKFVD